MGAAYADALRLASAALRLCESTEQAEQVERLAEAAHVAWAGWMRYVFKKANHRADGEVRIDNEWRERWQRQIDTPYAELREDEKESDRVEARKFLAALASERERRPSDDKAKKDQGSRVETLTLFQRQDLPRKSQRGSQMGEAFRDGERLGDAYGATKAEVLKTLEERHPDADEIRIKTLSDQITGAGKQTTTDVVEPLEKFFAFAHLPEHLRAVSQPFGELATHIIKNLPRNPERTVALRKLLEAKDCAVRSVL